MPKRAERELTAKFVEKIVEPGTYADSQAPGLRLQVSASGAKSWILRYQMDGRRREMGLGSVATVSLVDARKKAAEARGLAKEGTDPIVEKNRSADEKRARKAEEEARRVTFRAVAEKYIERKRAGWRNAKHAAQWTSSLETYAFPHIGTTPVSEIDLSAVLRVLDPIWRTKPETASRVRQRIETVLDAAKVEGLRDGENPARWKGNLKVMLPSKAEMAKAQNHAAMPYAALPAFWPRLRVQDGMGASALAFAILTAGRTGEVLGARWDEIDLDAAVWTIPAQRMKAKREHRVPLSEPAVAILRELATIRRGDYVFPGIVRGQPLSNMTMLATLRRMKADCTAHGFRSTFRTWVSETTTTPWEVAEAALAHNVGDETERAYARGDLFERRRKLMDAWASYVTGASAKVVPLRAAG